MVAWTRKHRTFSLLLGGLLVAMSGIADYVLGYAFSFVALYVLLVVLVTWTLGLEAGIAVGIISVITGACVDFLAGRSITHMFWDLITNGSLFGVMIFVLGDLQHALAQAQRMAEHDPLTGLANRGAFYEQAEAERLRCQRYGHPFTIAYLDCDNFKAINDRFGHQTGDALLCIVADILQHSVRSSDMVARLGGDEFIVGFVETGGDTALDTVQRMRQRLSEAMHQHDWPVTFSIGIATFMHPPTSVDMFIQCADQLMYAAKRSGKNAVRHAVIAVTALDADTTIPAPNQDGV